MKKKSIISMILMCALMFNTIGILPVGAEELAEDLIQTEVNLTSVSEQDAEPVEVNNEATEFDTELISEEPTLVNEYTPAPTASETPTVPSDELQTLIPVVDAVPSDESQALTPVVNEIPVVKETGGYKSEFIFMSEVPTFATSDSWYKGSTAKSAITEINIVDSYSATGFEKESWSAAIDDSIMCYVNGTTLTIAGNGTGRIMANANSSKMFSGFEKVTAINGLNLLNTSNVTNMSDMFKYCYKLTSLDLSSFDTSNVTNMGSMFYQCALTSLDLSGFNTSNVRNMEWMFFSLVNLTSLDVSSFDTSNVTNMRHMFHYCSGLTSLDLSNFDTSNVNDMNSMFYNCINLTSLDVSNFNTSNVTNMGNMFSHCEGLASINLSNFNTSNVTTMEEMFRECINLTSLDLSSFDTSNVNNMNDMFYVCRNLTSLDVSSFDTSNVTSMKNMFSLCKKLTSLDLSGFNTSNVTTMRGMFHTCENLISLDLSGWDTSSVTDMVTMFRECINLTSLNISGFDTTNLTTMSNMFYNCKKLTSLDLSSFDTSKVTDMNWVFWGCDGLTSFDLSGFDTTKVTTMNNMFHVNNSTPTVVYGANAFMKAYDWAADNRVVTFGGQSILLGTPSDEREEAISGETTNNIETTAPSDKGEESTSEEPTNKVETLTPSTSSNNVSTSAPVVSTNKVIASGSSFSGGGGFSGGSTGGGGGSSSSAGQVETPKTEEEDEKDAVSNPDITLKTNVEQISYMAPRQDGKFMADEAATRYEIISALANLFDIEETDVVKEFADVDKENAELVSLFSGASIIDGYTDGTFGGEKSITRAELIKVLTVMLDLDDEADSNVAEFKDIEGHWGKDYILKFVSNGYIKGYPDGTIRPDDNVTRAEAVTIINRIVNSSVKDSEVSVDVAEDHWAYNEIQKAIID